MNGRRNMFRKSIVFVCENLSVYAHSQTKDEKEKSGKTKRENTEEQNERLAYNVMTVRLCELDGHHHFKVVHDGILLLTLNQNIDPCYMDTWTWTAYGYIRTR